MIDLDEIDKLLPPKATVAEVQSLIIYIVLSYWWDRSDEARAIFLAEILNTVNHYRDQEAPHSYH